MGFNNAKTTNIFGIKTTIILNIKSLFKLSIPSKRFQSLMVLVYLIS